MPDIAELPANAQVRVTPEFESSFAAAFAADEATRTPPQAAPTPPPAPAQPESPSGLPTNPKPETAVAPTEEAVPEHIKSSKAAEDWKAQRRRIKELEPLAAKAREYETELTKLKTAPPATDEFKPKYEEAAKKLDEYQKLVRAADLANDPEFKTYFESKTKTLVGMAKSTVTTEQQAVVDKWLTRPESDARTAALEEVVTEIGMLRGQKLAAIINDVDRLHLERETELTKARENWDQLMDKRGKLTAAQQERTKAEADDAFSRALKSTKDKEKGLMLFQEREGDEGWNKAVKEREELARNIFKGDLSVDDRAKAAIWAADGAGERELAALLAKENAALKAELTAMKSGTPSPELGEAGGKGQREDVDNSPEGILRRARAIDFQR